MLLTMQLCHEIVIKHVAALALHRTMMIEELSFWVRFLKALLVVCVHPYPVNQRCVRVHARECLLFTVSACARGISGVLRALHTPSLHTGRELFSLASYKIVAKAGNHVASKEQQ